MRRRALIVIAAALPAILGMPAAAEDLFKPDRYRNLAADERAFRLGDVVTLVVYQSAEARNLATNMSGRDTQARASFQTDLRGESADVRFGGSFSGRGEVRRGGSIVAQISAQITEVLPNGDIRIEGEQAVYVNGEETVIGVRGIARIADIDADNTIPSGRLANAEIRYDGSGFATDSARPGILNRLFRLLGVS